MPVLKGIALRLQDPSAQPIPSFPDPSEEQVETCRTTSRLIRYTAGEPFRIVLYSPTSDPAGIPVQCEVLEIRVFVDENKMIWGPKFIHRGEDGQSLDIKITKGLWWPVPTTSSQQQQPPHVEKTVIVQLTPCRLARQITKEVTHHVNGEGEEFWSSRTTNSIPEAIPNTILTWGFKLMPQIASLQQRQQQEEEEEEVFPRPLTCFMDDIGQSPHPNQKTQRPWSLKPHGEPILSQNGVGLPSQMYCCGRQLRGADPDALTGKIPHTGVIVCDNDFCQISTWHKYCAGMEVWEEPERLWICPVCRVKDQRQIEIREGELSQDEMGVLEGSVEFR